MKRIILPVFCMIAGFMLIACGGKQDPGTAAVPPGEEGSGESAWDAGDFLDFYYTKENINYNAFYQRYRVYEEDGKHMFFHETRKVEGDYGPATEKNTTLKGCFELTEEEWKEFLDLLGQGSASHRSDHPEDGGSGPWLFLYLKDGDSEGYEFSFSSYSLLKEFEAWCARLADRDL